MKRVLPVLGLILAAAGCVTVPNSIMTPATVVRPCDRVTLGMTRAAVSSIMDARVVVGHEIDPDAGVFRPVEAQNLYSAELVKINDISYQVDRYIVRSPSAGDRVAEADLFPVVYKYGLVVATGRDGLAALMLSASPGKALK